VPIVLAADVVPVPPPAPFPPAPSAKTLDAAPPDNVALPLVHPRLQVPSPGVEIDVAFVRAEALAWESGSFERLTDGRAALKMTDEARLRRAHLTKYVKGVVGACALLCMAAFVRIAVGAVTKEPDAAPVHVAAALPLVVALPPPAPVAAPPPEPSAPIVSATPAPVTPSATTTRPAPSRANYGRGGKRRSPVAP
jgi:hypothetical protein